MRAKRARSPVNSAKYPLLLEQIRTQISSGKFPHGSRLPTTAEFAERLNVNKMTVQRALSVLAREGLLVRRCSRGTYVSEENKPPLIPGRTLRLGILWVRSSTPQNFDKGFDGDMWQGALAQWGIAHIDPEFVEQRGATQAIWRQPLRGLTVECVGGLLGEPLRRPKFEAVKNGKYDGLITLGIIDENWLDEILGLGLPTVLADYPGERFSSRADQVFVDPQSGYRAAVRHFVELGLKRVHFVGSLRSNPLEPGGSSRIDPDTFLRKSAFQQAMDLHGLPAPESWTHYEHSAPENLVALGKGLAALPENERPEAVLCHEVHQAEMLLDVFASHGLKLTGAGAAAQAHYGSALPIRIDGREVGRIAADLLLGRLQRSDRPLLNVGVRMTFQTTPVSTEARSV